MERENRGSCRASLSSRLEQTVIEDLHQSQENAGGESSRSGIGAAYWVVRSR